MTLTELEKLKEALLFGDDDVAALRRACQILVPQTEAILDVWYGFVGAHDFLLHYFSTPTGPSAGYLARVRARFGQWIADTCRAEYDAAWLAYQEEIGRRHLSSKNQTDGPAAAYYDAPSCHSLQTCLGIHEGIAISQAGRAVYDRADAPVVG